MKALRLAALAPLAVGAALTVSPLAEAGGGSAGRGPTILETAAQVGGFDVLLSAVRNAGLGHPLQADGPFTVFAPVNQAFLDLGPETLNALTQPENVELLRSILTYHVVAGEFDAATLIGLDFVTTLNGQRLDLEFDGQTLFVDGNAVQLADVGASNGVIHVIDTVLQPVQDTIPEVAANVGIFNTLLAAVDAADLENALRRPGPFTVFAPTDEAFAKLPHGVLDSLLQPENRGQLRSILLLHVASGELGAADVVRLSSTTPLARTVPAPLTTTLRSSPASPSIVSELLPLSSTSSSVGTSITSRGVSENRN